MRHSGEAPAAPQEEERVRLTWGGWRSWGRFHTGECGGGPPWRTAGCRRRCPSRNPPVRTCSRRNGLEEEAVSFGIDTRLSLLLL